MVEIWTWALLLILLMYAVVGSGVVVGGAVGLWEMFARRISHLIQKLSLH